MHYIQISIAIVYRIICDIPNILFIYFLLICVHQETDMKASNKRQSLLPAPKTLTHRSVLPSALLTTKTDDCASPAALTVSAADCPAETSGSPPHHLIQSEGNTSTTSKIKGKSNGQNNNSNDLTGVLSSEAVSGNLPSKHSFIEGGDTVASDVHRVAGKLPRSKIYGTGLCRLSSSVMAAGSFKKVDTNVSGKMSDITESKRPVIDSQLVADDTGSAGSATFKNQPGNSAKLAGVKGNNPSAGRHSGLMQPSKAALLKRSTNHFMIAKQSKSLDSASDTDFANMEQPKARHNKTAVNRKFGHNIVTKGKTAMNEPINLHSYEQLTNVGSLHLQAYDLEVYGDGHCVPRKSIEPTDSSMSSPFGSVRAMPDVIALSSSWSSRRSHISSLGSCGHIDAEQLASSDGSLGILDDNDLLNSSLLPAAFESDANSTNCLNNMLALQKAVKTCVETDTDSLVPDVTEDCLVSLTNEITMLSMKMNDLSSEKPASQETSEEPSRHLDVSIHVNEEHDQFSALPTTCFNSGETTISVSNVASGGISCQAAEIAAACGQSHANEHFLHSSEALLLNENEGKFNISLCLKYLVSYCL